MTVGSMIRAGAFTFVGAPRTESACVDAGEANRTPATSTAATIHCVLRRLFTTQYQRSVSRYGRRPSGEMRSSQNAQQPLPQRPWQRVLHSCTYQEQGRISRKHSAWLVWLSILLTARMRCGTAQFAAFATQQSSRHCNKQEAARRPPFELRRGRSGQILPAEDLRHRRVLEHGIDRIRDEFGHRQHLQLVEPAVLRDGQGIGHDHLGQR